MFEDSKPKRKLGILRPLLVSDNGAYEFYRLAPAGVMAVETAVGLSEFTAADVERVFEPLDEKVDMLMERGIDLIMQSGVPLPILIGLDAHDRLVDRMAKRTGKPATSSVLAVTRAAAHLGIKNIAFANKWSEPMNKNLSAFFAREGVETAGIAAEVMGPSEFQKMGTDASIHLAYRLGRQALEQYPEADGLYIGGGAWLVQPVVEKLEQDYGKPVIANVNALIWETLHLVDFWKPIKGHGVLLASN